MYMYTMECYSAIKRNKSESVVVRWVNAEPVTQRLSKSEREKQILYISPYMNSEK